jgi:nitric oxide reductase subunit B
MVDENHSLKSLSPWWRHSVIIVMVIGFTILIWLSIRTYSDAPPIPEKVSNASGKTIFTGADILSGQQVFLKYGLMENGSIWGHGAYLGPDFSAEYLHVLSTDARETISKQNYGKGEQELTTTEQNAVNAQVQQLLKENRYNVQSQILGFTEVEALSYERQLKIWTEYFSEPINNAGLPVKYINDPKELQQLTAFFAWTAWASVVNRPGKSYTYTNNFPYDSSIGNTPTSDAILWSALSLITLLSATALGLFAIGRFDFLGWKGKSEHIHPQMIPGVSTPSQKATVKYFVIVALLFLAQVLVGGGTAHYRADPGTFFGIDVTRYFPSNILRTWHLQLAILWVATAYVAGGLFFAPSLGGSEPKGQAKGVNLLFGALVIVSVGSLFGEWLGINQLLGSLWFWIGHQGWEYLDLGRLWQILLAVGLVFWVFLLFRGIAPARKNPQEREIASLFLYAAIAIPLFYLPAMFFNSTTHFSIVDTWRFWIIHLWVEGFFELFVTVMVAIIFYKLGMVSHTTATRVVYLDAILYLGSGIVGTGHHWYWTGQSSITMAFAAMFSAMEVVPLTLLTLDAWDFIKLTKGTCDICGKKIAVPHKWTFYFLISVGVWNFIGAGIFGFLINLPVVSYFEVGTLLTPNHGHAAMMGVFGMLGIALMVFVFRQVSLDSEWERIEKYIRTSFWGLNIGLALMVVTNLFPGGVMQLTDVLNNGYWHARSLEYLHKGIMHTIEWLRLPGDVIFIVFGVVPLVVASGKTYKYLRNNSKAIAS